MDAYGWEEDPPDGLIIRLRTKLGQLRIWRFGKDGIRQVNGLDFAGPMQHPGIYMLYEDGEQEVYVGESSDLKKRLRNHYRGGPRGFKKWDQVVVVNDGRSYAQSILTDVTLREFLEKSLIRHLDEGGLYHPINKVTEKPRLSVAVKVIAENLDQELLFVLEKMGFVVPCAEPPVRAERILHPRLKKILENANYHVDKVVRDRWIINGESFFERSGTAPRRGERGWHITLRIKPRQALSTGKGALLISRGRGYLIPADKIKDWLGKELWPIKPGKEAIDIYVDLRKENLLYKVDFPELSLTDFRLTLEEGI